MILLYIFYACYYRVFYFIEYELDDYGGYSIDSFNSNRILIGVSSLYGILCLYRIGYG